MDGELIAARLELDKVLAASGGRVEAAPGAWRLALSGAKDCLG